jgi:MarR-like DNA-binding transcriptional regulator SgrR of sgrS sRNA
MPDPRGPSRYYTVKDLAEMWQSTPRGVRQYLYRMRHERQIPPRPGQTRIKKINRARRILLIRDDYAALVQQRLLERA